MENPFCSVTLFVKLYGDLSVLLQDTVSWYKVHDTSALDILYHNTAP